MLLIFMLMIVLLFAVLIDTAEIETAIAIEDMDRLFARLDAHLCTDCSINFRAEIARDA